ncbi:hypothetical protein GF314_10150 [bacterium]|nr:hypothetical protein [bacterium]
MIRPRDDGAPAPRDGADENGGPVTDQTTPEASDRNPWRVADLPPELEYFQRSEAYQVELTGFQGPMDLLLYLIQKDELDIYDIPISHITEQFIKHIEVIHMISLDQAGEFMAMASTLLVIKMKMLMPRHGDADEEVEEEDPRAELVRRLLEYKRFKEAARQLQSFEKQRSQYHVRTTRYPFVDHLDLEPQLRIEMYDLLSALAGVLDRVQAAPVHAVTREPYTVAEKLDLIRGAVAERETIRFEDCFEDDAIRMEVIVSFIALLELVKRGELEIYQTAPRGPIWLKGREGTDEVPPAIAEAEAREA